MDRFSDAEKRYIVMRLACFASPKQVAKDIHELFALDAEPPLSRITFYNPQTVAGGERLDPELQQLFKDTRELYKACKDDIPIATQLGRLTRLQELLDGIERNVVLAASIIEQAAKEEGGFYVRRPLDANGVGSGPGTDSLMGLPEDELDRRLAEARQRAGERASQ